MKDPGIYAGVWPTYRCNQEAYIYRRFSHEEEHRGKKVKYWHVWKASPGNLKSPFGEDLNKSKVRDLDKMFRNDE